MIRLSPAQGLVVDQFRDRNRPRDLLVSAGAGSGKTLVLVESVLAALESGVPLDRILVVTFTEKAAAEMQSRIDRELDRSPTLASLRPRLPQAFLSTIHSFCARLLRERFDEADLDPRFRVLSAEDADLMLEESMTRVFHEEYEKARRQAEKGSSATPAFEALVEMCGYDQRGERLRDVVRRLIEYARTSEEPERFLPAHEERLRQPAQRWEDLPWAEAYAERIGDALNGALGLLRLLAEGLEEEGFGASRFRELHEKLRDVDPGSLSDPDRQRAVLDRLHAAGAVRAGEESLRIRLPSLPRGAPAVFGPLKKMTTEAFTSEWLTEMPLDARRVLGDERSLSRFGLALIRLARRVLEAYDAAKERTGTLDFADLEARALRLIEARAEGEDPIRFERLFIDEFQDINGLQNRILSRLAGPEATFRVGDIKQSIYQFRLAEPGIIRSLAAGRAAIRDRESIPAAGGAWNVLLSENYRSLPPVLAFVNRIAGGLFLAEEIGGSYDLQALVPAAGPEGTPPPVEILLAERPSRETAGARDEAEEEEEEEPEHGGEKEEPIGAREAEHGAIAGRIRELLDEGAIVRDPREGTPRPIRPGDIAILLRTRKAGPDLARRLEAEGIPASLGADDPLFEAQEVRDLQRILLAVDNLLDDVSLAAALRSPAFGWSDTALLACRLAYPRATQYAYCLAGLAAESRSGEPIAAAVLPLDPREREPLLGPRAELPGEPPFAGLADRAARALEPFLSWREAAGEIELPELVARILEETDLLRSAAAMPGGLRRRANLRKLLGIARRYAREAGHDLHRFLRWLDALAEGRARISAAPIAAESLPAVRILTIHAAKGLEFPVVILADTDRPLGRGGRALPVVPGRRLLGVRLLDPDAYVYRRPQPLRLLEDEDRAEEIAEEKRVLYVALTRARDRLIVTGAVDGKRMEDASVRGAYRRALRSEEEDARAAREAILQKRARVLDWIDFALGEPLASGEERRDGAAGLPLTIRRMLPVPAAGEASASNPILERRASLLRLEPTGAAGPEDEAVRAAFERARAGDPLPRAGLLRTARGKIWATEMKGGPDPSRDGWLREETDEPAVPLLAATGEERRAEGTRIHRILERIDFAGIDRASLEERIDRAADGEALPESSRAVLARGLARLLEHPIGRRLAGGGEIHREIPFSLRVPLLAIARWLPDLREEILAAEGWAEQVEEEPGYGLRLRAGAPAEAADPWVLVQGRIDLALVGADGTMVLDWKTDAVAGERAVEERASFYRGQMEIYAEAAAALFPGPIRAALYFLRPGTLREIETGGSR